MSVVATFDEGFIEGGADITPYLFTDPIYPIPTGSNDSYDFESTDNGFIFTAGGSRHLFTTPIYPISTGTDDTHDFETDIDGYSITGDGCRYALPATMDTTMGACP